MRVCARACACGGVDDVRGRCVRARVCVGVTLSMPEDILEKKFPNVLATTFVLSSAHRVHVHVRVCVSV